MGRTFPVEKLIPQEGCISGQAGSVVIRIPLEPFTVDNLKVETSIGIDSIRMPTPDLPALAGRSFRFVTLRFILFQFFAPDASVYIQHAHHPIDVSRIEFGAASDVIDAKLTLKYCFSHEGLMDFIDTPHVLACKLRAE